MATTSDDLSTLYFYGHVQSVITSYGKGHCDAPGGSAIHVDATVLRNPPADPAVRDQMLHSTGLDPAVRSYVLATPGAADLVRRHAERVRALLHHEQLLHRRTGGQRHRVDVHVACGGGRHRSVAIAEELAVHLRSVGIGCEVEHLHISRPILQQ